MIKPKVVKLNNRISANVAPKNYKGVTFFPSPGEYPIYDEKSYDHMEADNVTGKAYATAIKNLVKGKRVLDIGTGQYFDWAYEAISKGAQEAVGLEGMESTYKKAIASWKKLPKKWKEKIILINEWSENYKDRGNFDIMISEVIGSIGSSEGAIATIEGAKSLLRPDGKMIPFKCITKAAGICIQDLCPQPLWDADAVDLLKKLMKFNHGSLPKPRLQTSNRPFRRLTTSDIAVETLDFEQGNYSWLKTPTRVKLSRTPKRKGNKEKIDGLLLWIELFTEKGSKPIDSLYNKTGWDPIYLPIFDEPVEIGKDDEVYISFYLDNIHNNFKNVGYLFPSYTAEIFIMNEKKRTTISKTKGFSYDEILDFKEESKSIYSKLFNI